MKNNERTRPQNLLAVLTPGEIEYLKKEYEEVKGAAENSDKEYLVFAFGYALDAQELQKALNTSLEEKSNAALRLATLNYIIKAKNDAEYARGAAPMGKFLAETDTESGILFLETAARKFSETRGMHPEYAKKCNLAIEEAREEAERKAAREKEERSLRM